MYPKNAASPQRVAIGPVVQISDGAVQTSGVSVKVMPQGGAAGAGGGTIAYEEGIVYYAPTQAETNYASFILIAYKTGCIPATCTVVTTASAVAGHAGVDWAVINAPTTTVALSGTTVGTVTTLTGHTAQTGDSYARIGANGAGLTSLASQASVTAIDDLLDTEMPALTSAVADLPTNAELATALAAADDAVLAAIAALNNLSAAQVNAEVVDALNVDTYAEISSIPAATTTLTNMIRLLFSMTRNKTTQTATTFLLRNDADSATIGTATVSDDGTTAIKGELA